MDEEISRTPARCAGVPLSTRGQDTVMRANTTQLWKESTANVPPLFWSRWPCRPAPETPPPTVFQMQLAKGAG